MACLRCHFSLVYIVASYGYCCSYCSCNTKVEEEKKIATTQEHKKPATKKNSKTQSEENFVAFSIK
jgi:hypothetical protein